MYHIYLHCIETTCNFTYVCEPAREISPSVTRNDRGWDGRGNCRLLSICYGKYHNMYVGHLLTVILMTYTLILSYAGTEVEKKRTICLTSCILKVDESNMEQRRCGSKAMIPKFHLTPPSPPFSTLSYGIKHGTKFLFICFV